MNYRIFYFSTNHLQTGCMEKSNFGFFELRKKNLAILARWKKWDGGYFE